MATNQKRPGRGGGVYIAVLGSAMIIALLAMCALIGQRIENRLVSGSTDIRQAQLNANTAVETALLMMKQDTSWRTNNTNGNWFVSRSTGNGTCTANVVDPNDGNLSNNSDDPVVVTGIGYSGLAQQRVQVTVDPRKDPLSCLRSAVAAGGNITLSSDTLRTNGLTTANQVAATSSQVYGKVEATSVTGSTYNSTTTQVTSDKRPTMPDWTSVFNYYRTNGAQIDIGSVPTWPAQATNLGQNYAIENGTTYWTGSPPGIASADLSQSTTFNHTSPTGSKSLMISNRASWISGGAQYIDGFLKPSQQYIIEGYVYLPLAAGNIRLFRFTMFAKGVNQSVQQVNGPDTVVLSQGWRYVSATITALSWTGNLEYAFIKIAGSDATNTTDFYFDDLNIRENSSGKYIYRSVIGPGVNTIYSGAPTNSEGVYVIDCKNNKLVIERSRIYGTLLVLNPGAGSCIGNGPINWSPAVAGYPALLVDADTPTTADFGIYATNRALSEKENGINYNQTGAPHDEFGTNATFTDIYRSSIRGLIAVRHDLTSTVRPIRGQIMVGNNITNSSGELEVEYLPDSLLNPPSGFWSYTYPRRTGSVQKVVLP